MPQPRHADEPTWPEEFREYRENDGWKSELDWEMARVRWARAHGFRQYKMLPLLRKMIHRPGGGS
jgi:hypothetical protein